MNFIHQKHAYSIIAAGLATFLSIFVPGLLWATPETGVDFSQTAVTVEINATALTPPDVLRIRNITCPEDGFVVAIANGGVGFSTIAAGGVVSISLSRNSTAIDANHQLQVSGQFTEVPLFVPVSIQRVDPCQQGSSPAYRFLGTLGFGAPADARIQQPSLILMFFRDRL